ncbi:MAG: iron-containing alcohol dehydrogenase [Chloroflexi bacterium]|nr:iron-containing alcohol dehydrogenase [Chloroflexota bacterium]
MDLVLVGLPGTGKTAVGRRLARRHGAAFVDLDSTIEAAAGRPIPAIFAEEGEAGFRAREREAVGALGPPDPSPTLSRVIATGGGTPLDPRNRWALYRGRLAVWLDGPPGILATRLRRSPVSRPLLAGLDPEAAIAALAAARERVYAPALRVNGVAPLGQVVATVERHLDDAVGPGGGLLRARTPIGTLEIGDGVAAAGIARALGSLEARRAIVVSEPKAWSVAGEALAADLARDGVAVETVLLPRGEPAKTLRVIERAARDLARLRAERRDPIVAVGGGALGDAAGFLAATWLRGVPVVHVPTTLVAQIDSSIGGKTAVDLPEGKNLVGAFHQPAAIVADVAALRTLPSRHLRAALGEAVKMGALGDERLLELLEIGGRAIAAGDGAAFASGAVAEVVERCAWAKVEVVVADEREHGEAGGRIALNLGHSLAHAIETVAAYRGILHGEAVAYGLRAAVRIGAELGVTPQAHAERIESLLDGLGLGARPLAARPEALVAALAVDKKTAGGRLRWVLSTGSGVVVRSDVPDALVAAAAAGIVAGRSAAPVGGTGAARAGRGR